MGVVDIVGADGMDDVTDADGWIVVDTNILSKLHELFRTLCVQKYTILIKAPIKESILT